MDTNNLTTCLSCEASLNNAYTLPCMHNYCTECITNLQTDNCFKCKKCNHTFKNDLIKRNIFIEKLNNILTTINESKLCIICEKLAAEQYCSNCAQLMCNNCSILHLKMKSSQGHQMILKDKLKYGDFKTQEPSCDKHEELFKIFCITCNIGCCTTCFVLEHEGHDKINVGGSHEASGQSLLAKSQSLNVILKNDEECVNYYLYNKDSFIEHIINVKEKVKNQGDFIKQQVDFRVNFIYGELDKLKDKRINLMNSNVSKTQNHIEYIQGVNTQVNKILKNGSKLDKVLLDKEIRDVDYNLYMDPTPETLHNFVFFDINIPKIGLIKDYEIIPLQGLIKSINLNKENDIYAFNILTGKLQIYLKNTNNNNDTCLLHNHVIYNNLNTISINNIQTSLEIGTYTPNPVYNFDCTSLNDSFNYESLHVILSQEELIILLALPQNLLIKKIDLFGNLYDVATLQIIAKQIVKIPEGIIVTSTDKIYEIGYNGVIIKEYAYPPSLVSMDILCVKIISNNIGNFVLFNKIDYSIHFFANDLVNALSKFNMTIKGKKTQDFSLACNGIDFIFLLEKNSHILSIFLIENKYIKMVEQTLIEGARDVIYFPDKRIIFILINKNNLSYIQTHKF